MPKVLVVHGGWFADDRGRTLCIPLSGYTVDLVLWLGTVHQARLRMMTSNTQKSRLHVFDRANLKALQKAVSRLQGVSTFIQDAMD